jgi:hypothetical protein
VSWTVYAHLLDLAPVQLVGFLRVVFDYCGLGWGLLEGCYDKTQVLDISLRILAWWWFTV